MKRNLVILMVLIALLTGCNSSNEYNSTSSEENEKRVAEASEFDSILWINEGYIRVKKDNKYGLIKNGGEVIIEPKYDYISDYMGENGYRYFEQDDLYGYIDEEGNVVIEPQFDDASLFEKDGTAKVRMGLTFYVINEKGEILGIAN